MADRIEDLFTVETHDGRIIATAIHDGHELRAEVAAQSALDEGTRLREEDPFTGRLATVARSRLVPKRSRFEVDLNRPREAAVYRSPEEAWGLQVWREPPPEELVERSLAIHDLFYETLHACLSDTEARHGSFVVLDVHAYNHRRGGPHAAPEPVETNPDVNVGTGTVDRARWGELVNRFMEDLRGGTLDGRPLDVRENVRFRGRHLPAWVNTTFPGSGCALALEFKKVFMDEWTGRLFEPLLDQLAAALEAAVPGLLESLDGR